MVSPTQWKSLSKLQEIVKDRKPGVMQSMGSQGAGCGLATEQQQLEGKIMGKKFHSYLLMYHKM